MEEGIPDSVIKSHAQDLMYAHKLTKTTLTCSFCQKRHFIDQYVEGVQYCQCSNRKTSVYGVSIKEDGSSDESGSDWSPFLERKDVLVWRREHPEFHGLYAYKMYGKFDDISAKEFLEVQMDLSEFRLQWDNSTAQCHVIKQDDANGDSSLDVSVVSDVSQLYYWEVTWPRLFSNRDYVCSRRAVTFASNNANDKRMVIYTKSAEHPGYPEKSKTFRVKDYVSVITIQPFKSFDEPGLEFSLTAFENPGVSLPSYITTWVAIRGMPEFMVNLRKACIERRKWRKRRTSSVEYTTAVKEPSYMETPPQKMQRRANVKQQQTVYSQGSSDTAAYA